MIYKLKETVARAKNNVINSIKGDLFYIQDPVVLFLSQVKNFKLNRFDIVLKMLAVEHILGKNNFGLELYLKGQELRLSEKANLKKFDSDLRQLVSSFQKEGFNENYPIITNQQNQVRDGAHRLACSLVFGLEKIKTKRSDSFKVDYSRKWFRDNFSTLEYNQIEERFEKLINDTDIRKHLSNQVQYMTSNVSWKDKLSRNPKSFGRGEFYQSFEPLGISGQRPTEHRIKKYNILKHINESDKILDIGSNCGFMSIALSDKVQSIYGVEANPYFASVSNATATYLNKSNLQFDNLNFVIDGKKKYNLIFSFAVHYWIGINLETYLSGLHSMLLENGKLLIESQNIETVDSDFENKLLNYISSSNSFKLIEQGEICDDKVITRKFFWLYKI